MHNVYKNRRLIYRSLNIFIYACQHTRRRRLNKSILIPLQLLRTKPKAPARRFLKYPKLKGSWCAKSISYFSHLCCALECFKYGTFSFSVLLPLRINTYEQSNISFRLLINLHWLYLEFSEFTKTQASLVHSSAG